MKPDSAYDDTAAYRRGVVLGFTVAEIILLFLFALLLALATLLLSGRNSVDRAKAVNERFDTALVALAKGDSTQFLKSVNAVIADEVDYQKKLEGIEKKYRTQYLPDDVYAEIRSQKLDLSTPAGKEQFLDLLSKALVAQRNAAKKSEILEKDFEATCHAGSVLQKSLGKDADPSKIVNTLKDTKGREEYWRSQAAKCGLAGNLPPCYKEKNSDPTPYLYDARIGESGITLVDTIPDTYRARFTSDFQSLPPTNRLLSDAEFRELTFKFLEFGNKNQCRFYVTVYDDLGNNKQRLKDAMKTIESNFYKKITW